VRGLCAICSVLFQSPSLSCRFRTGLCFFNCHLHCTNAHARRLPRALCRSTPAGEDLLQSSRRAVLRILIPSHTAAGLNDYVEVPQNSKSDDAQPDAVRKAARIVDRAGHEMKCDEEIPAYSSVTTNNVQIFAQGFYKGAENGEHWWMYRIEFKNVGKQRVQLLARHWVFVDSNGKTHEVKGPGARGLTPKISPGRTFKYESGTPLATASGSMYGSFQFQVLRLQDGSKPETPIFFSARVGRLALTPDNTPAMVPCGEEAPEGRVPLTSVWATDRVIVGVTSSYISPEEAEEVFGQTPGDATAAGHKEQHTFLLDVQVDVDQRLCTFACTRARARGQMIVPAYRHHSDSCAHTESRTSRCSTLCFRQ
jgi:uncharacterized protein affecting Mg2+/Co2+ transport